MQANFIVIPGLKKFLENIVFEGPGEGPVLFTVAARVSVCISTGILHSTSLFKRSEGAN